jgi:SAM-dependent methyltransferase
MDESEVHRKYCNIVKKQLLRDAVLFLKNTKGFDKINLLDLGSGRGGDIFKWGSLKINRVYGVDPDVSSVEEAINRYKKNRRKCVSKVSFYKRSATDTGFITDKILHKRKVNMVSCMFALHYFFENPQLLDKFFSTVSENLCSGGVFIGIAPDSKYILKLLDPEDKYKNPNVLISSNEDQSYNFKIRDKKGDDYFSFKGESKEFLIDKTIFIKNAEKFGLKPIQVNKHYGAFTNLIDGNGLGGNSNSISQLYFLFSFLKV